jgi:flagellar hook-associated protein 2
MAGITASGVGSGLDINGLVSQLVAAERAPQEQRLIRQETKVTIKLSALGSLKGALAGFKSALDPLKSASLFQSRTATSGDSSYFTASADTKAATGSYDVEVLALAKAHQLASAAFADGSSTVVGHGTLTIAVGDQSFDVTISEADNTLADIRDAINASENNIGVQATLINTTDGTRLVLRSNKTGADHAITVTASGGDGGLEQLVYDPDGTMNLTELVPAQNARIRLAGSDDFIMESDTNVFRDVIDGVTITVKKQTEAGQSIGLEVAFDRASVISNIEKFVTEYNKMQATLAKLRSYDAKTQAAGPLLGDALLRGIEEEVRRALTDPVTGSSEIYTTLASIGIKTSASGQLELDKSRLNAALEADPNALAHLFSSENGIASRLSQTLKQRLATDGDIDTRTSQLNREVKEISKQKEALQYRMEQIEARYRKQFTALDSLLMSMQSTSRYLAQQLDSISKLK